MTYAKNRTTRLVLVVSTLLFAGSAWAGGDKTTEEKVRLLDTDADGRASLSEYTRHEGKTAEDFAKLDVNADGYATVAELEVAKERGPTAGEKKDTRAKAYPVPTTNPKSEVTDD